MSSPSSSDVDSVMTWFPSRSSPVPAGGMVPLNTLSATETDEIHEYDDIVNYRPLADTEVIRNQAYTTTQGQRSAAVGVVASEYDEISSVASEYEEIFSEAQGQSLTDVGPDEEYDNVYSEF